MTGTQLDTIFTIGEVFNNHVASPALDSEGVISLLTPAFIFAASANQNVIIFPTIKAIFTLFAIQDILGFVANDLVLSATAIDVFD